MVQVEPSFLETKQLTSEASETQQGPGQWDTGATSVSPEASTENNELASEPQYIGMTSEQNESNDEREQKYSMLGADQGVSDSVAEDELLASGKNAKKRARRKVSCSHV